MSLVFEVKKPFKSVGKYYPKGHRFTEEEFYNPSILRLGKVKVSEGFIVPLFLEEEPPLPNPEEPVNITNPPVILSPIGPIEFMQPPSSIEPNGPIPPIEMVVPFNGDISVQDPVIIVDDTVDGINTFALNEEEVSEPKLAKKKKTSKKKIK